MNGEEEDRRRMFAVSVADVLGVRGGGQKCSVSEETFILMDNLIIGRKR